MTTTSSSAPAVAVDLSDLERHLKSRLSLAWECLELTEGDPGATAATVNTARMEMGKLKKEVAETREDIRRWREMIKKVRSTFRGRKPSGRFYVGLATPYSVSRRSST